MVRPMTGHEAVALSLVVPCYNEEEVLHETASRLAELLQELVVDGLVSADSRVVYVDDGSNDATWSIIEQLAAESGRIAGLKLSRNRGHQNALLAGLLTVPGDAVISLDADLQDDITVIPEMLERFREGSEVVYGVRRSRARDSWFKRSTARLFYRVMRWASPDMIADHADFRLLSRRAIEELRRFGEVNLYLRGMVPLIGLPSAIVTYDRQARSAGETKYPLRKMLAFAFDGISSFSAIPLRAITVIGLLTFLACVGISVWALSVRLFTDHAIPGWASTVLPIYALGAIQILCLGVVGEYLAKIYQEVKARPRFIVEKTVGLELGVDPLPFADRESTAHVV
jgi:glycosyltransferase involved in cell wall biosynthesis